MVARWKGGDFFPGAVAAANADGTYVVQFDDGDLESAEPHAHMVPAPRRVPRPSCVAGGGMLSLVEHLAECGERARGGEGGAGMGCFRPSRTS